MTNLDYISEYASESCLDKDDVIEIAYSMCADCPISTQITDTLSLSYHFPNGEIATMFSFETIPVSFVLHIGELRRRLNAYGYFPFELESLIECCELYATDTTDEYMYLDINAVIDNLHDIVTSVREFSRVMYIK